MSKPKIVILGAGYGGVLTVLNLQRKLTRQDAEIILINKNDYHYFTTELHQPAAGSFPDEKTKISVSEVVNEKKVKFIQKEVSGINFKEQKVSLDNVNIDYDYLIISLGGESETFGIPGLKEYAFGKWTLDGAKELRNHIQSQFQNYGKDSLEPLTIVVGGAGFTGIELVSELAERIPKLCKEYDVPRNKVRLVCVEAAPNALPGFDSELVEYATEKLISRGVEFSIGTAIKECTKDGVILADGKVISAGTVVWAAGVRGNNVVEKSGLENTRGRVGVNKQLQAPGYDNVYVIGDSSFFINEETNRPYPPTAQIAIQMGTFVAKKIVATIKDNINHVEQFKPSIKGTVASLGHRDAIGIVGKKKVRGFVASMLKRVIDIRYLFIIGGIKLVMKKGRF